MPLIEELPQTRASAGTPGWAYVPDTGADPSKAAIMPVSTGRKRRAAAPVAAAKDVTARQHSKIQQHLASLDRDNNRDVQIVIPDRPRDLAQRGLRGKMTTAVRRILTSQKTFANHLDDEEAAIALEQEQAAQAASSRSNKGAAAARGKRSSLVKVESAPDLMDVDEPDEHTQATATVKATLDDPLLETHAPAMPTAQEIETLIRQPPLSYSASRASPSTSSAPARQFCEICGYWGRARCMKCGTRICGLECKTRHEETNCTKFWA